MGLHGSLHRPLHRPLAAGVLALGLSLPVATPATHAATSSAPDSVRAVPGATKVRLDGVAVKLRPGTRQVITVNRTKGSRARVTYWGLKDGRWRAKVRTTKGRIGYGGLVKGSRREQGTGTTPLGTYPIESTFGSGKRKASWTMPYRRFDRDDYWVLDNRSTHYNQWRDRDQGGFRWWLPSSHLNASERLVDHGQQYEMAAVIGFNTVDPVRYRGGGIFLHVNGKAATAGCVGVPRWFMRKAMHRLSPGREPVIAIGR